MIRSARRGGLQSEDAMERKRMRERSRVQNEAEPDAEPMAGYGS